MTLIDIAAALVRTTLATSLAALVAWGLLALLRVNSPRIHRIAWLLVISQGWLFFPLTIEIESPPPATTPPRAAGLVPAVIANQQITPFEKPQRGRAPVAPSDSLLVEAPPSPKFPDPFLLAIAAWLLGGTAIVVSAARRYLQVLRTLPLGAPPDDPAWQTEWRAARSSAKLRRRQRVDLRVTVALGPLLHWAPWTYLVLVPRTLWTTLAAPQRQAILRHELAHLRRGDLWKSLAIRALALPQWFNPLAWAAVRRFDEAAEWACDDAAAATVGGRLAFADSLLQSAEYALAPCPGAAPAARGLLTRRIHRLVSPRFKEESKMKLLFVPTLLIVVAASQIIRIERVVADEPPVSVPPRAEAKNPELPRSPLSEQQRLFEAMQAEGTPKVDYVIEPPDILLIESDKLVPKAPHRIENFDKLLIRASVASQKPAIDDSYNVDADGEVVLGAPYGRIKVGGRTIEEAEDVICDQLSQVIAHADVSVTLLAASRASSITGQHLVAMDGYVDLGGFYGTVYVAGMTPKEARAAIELKLAEQLDDPKVFVDVLAYNSKVYYVIVQGDRSGNDVVRRPVPYPFDGRETIGVALSRLSEGSYESSQTRKLVDSKVTLSRPTSLGGPDRLIQIEWDRAKNAPTALTNYPLLPGDRLFIQWEPRAEKPHDDDQSAKEYEDFKRTTYVIEPPDVVALRVSYSHSSFDEAKGVLDVETPYLNVAECMDEVPKRYIVGMDGCIKVDKVTSIRIAGMTLREAEETIRASLSPRGMKVKVRLSVAQFNSKVYYVITKRTGAGDEVTRLPIPFPVDGKENVAEALARSYDNADRALKLSELAAATLSLHRPATNGVGQERVYAIVWDPSLQAPTPGTNHGILPGDRIVIQYNAAASLQPTSQPPKGVELSVKRIGNSLLFVPRSAKKDASGETGNDAGVNLRMAPRWIESARRRPQSTTPSSGPAKFANRKNL